MGRPSGLARRGNDERGGVSMDADDLPASEQRQSTPVYQRDRIITEKDLKKQGPRTSRDVLHSVLSDSYFHSFHELSNQEGFVLGECFVALGQLIEAGYEFTRKSNSLQMRKRSGTDAPQDLIDLLAGIDGREPEDVNPMRAHERAKARIDFEQGVGPEPVEDTEVSYKPSWSGAEVREEAEREEESGPGFSSVAEPIPSPVPGDLLIISADGSLKLPARASVTSTRAILAKKGSGKTYLAMVIAEEFLNCGKVMPFVVIDPTGAWYGLSSLANAQPSPNPVLILGGVNGEMQVAPDQGALVAKIVTSKWPCPVVIDVSEMFPEEQHLFVSQFGESLYATNRNPLHIFIDEADEFAPQHMDSTYKYQRRCFHVIDRLVRRGRNRGIGLTAITQRAAVLHKNLLTQVDGIFVMHMVAPHDIEAVDTWMKPIMSSSDRSACLQALPKLGVGEGFFMQGGSLVVPCIRFLTRPKRTFDSSRTPSVDEPNPPIPVLGHVAQEIVEFAGVVLGTPLEPQEDDGSEA
jgi:Helicase HerA, central domain